MTFTHGFQSTLPARGATSSTFADLLGSAHFNPRSPHGERRAGESRLRRADSISIHAPRTGSDRSGAGRTAVHLPISIHAPRTGSDIINNSTFETIKISIHAPRTGSDRESPAHGAGLHYFNPRSPHGERHAPHQRRPSAFDFNPRSPHGERRDAIAPLPTQRDFNPRSPHGERRQSSGAMSMTQIISIHAPRTGSDGVSLPRELRRIYFNPRSPHGERQAPSVSFLPGTYFNPRSPHGERLKLSGRTSRQKEFQSTLPARGATSSTNSAKSAKIDFNPRSPHGERPNGRKNQDGWNGFQSTLPARGATPGRMEDPHDLQISIHAPRTGSDRDEAAEFVRRLISIHAPRTGSDSGRL